MKTSGSDRKQTRLSVSFKINVDYFINTLHLINGSSSFIGPVEVLILLLEPSGSFISKIKVLWGNETVEVSCRAALFLGLTLL